MTWAKTSAALAEAMEDDGARTRAFNALARVHQQMGSFEEFEAGRDPETAERMFREALQVGVLTPGLTVVTRSSRAVVLSRLDRLDEADAEARRALELAESGGPGRFALFFALYNGAIVQRARGADAEMERLLVHALAVDPGELGEEQHLLAKAGLSLAEHRLRRGRHDDAEALAVEALPRARGKPGPGSTHSSPRSSSPW